QALDVDHTVVIDKLDPGRGFDSGVAILRTPIAGVAPIPLRHEPLTHADEHARVRFVGYGETAGPLEEPTDDLPQGVKREASAPIEFVTDRTFFAGNAAGATCLGDSGGPALMTMAGREVVVGVTSNGSQLCAEAGVFVRVDIVAADLDRIIALTP